MIDELERPRCVAGLNHQGKKKESGTMNSRNRELGNREDGKGGAPDSEMIYQQ